MKEDPDSWGKLLKDFGVSLFALLVIYGIITVALNLAQFFNK